MTISVYFRLQNYKPDIPVLTIKNHRKIDPKNTEAECLIQNIDRIKSTGIEMISENGISIFYKDSNFFIKCRCKELEASGRTPEIEIYSQVPTLSLNYNVEDWSFDICDRIQSFSNKFEIHIEEEYLPVISEKLLAINTRHQLKKRYLYFTKLLLGLISPILMCVIIQEFFIKLSYSFQVITIGIIISISNLIMMLFFEKIGGK